MPEVRESRKRKINKDIKQPLKFVIVRGSFFCVGHEMSLLHCCCCCSF